MELQGASILIAGGTGGLGSRLADELDQRGANVTIAARTIEERAGVVTVAADLRLPDASTA